MIEYEIKVMYYTKSLSASEQVYDFRSREIRCSSDERGKDHSKAINIKVGRREAYREVEGDL